ncbi:type II toxin-antitoxin system RelE/ParE family toxin, partial [Pseudomonas aeruginosa]
VGKDVRPRHFVLYRLATDQVLEVVRVLHDSMDLDQHLPQR